MPKPKISKQDYSRYTLQLLKVLLRHRGEVNALTGERISEILGGLDTRTIAELAGLLTAQGFWICSGMGYWYALTELDWKKHLNKERDRGIVIIKKTVQAKKNSVNEPNLFDMVA
jgi:hypothetical protein